MSNTPFRVALLNDFNGVDCDIVLYDAFASGCGASIRGNDILGDCRDEQLVVYTWNLDAALAKASTSVDTVAGTCPSSSRPRSWGRARKDPCR